MASVNEMEASRSYMSHTMKPMKDEEDFKCYTDPEQSHSYDELDSLLGGDSVEDNEQNEDILIESENNIAEQIAKISTEHDYSHENNVVATSPYKPKSVSWSPHNEVQKFHDRSPLRSPFKEKRLNSLHVRRSITVPTSPKLATAKNGEKLYSCVTVPKEEVSQENDNKWKDRHVTKPLSPNLATAKNGPRCYSSVTDLKLEETEEKEDDKWKDRHVTKPLSPKFATAKNGPRCYSSVTEAKLVEEEDDKWKDRQVTVPTEFTFQASRKSYSCITAPKKEKVEEINTWIDRKITIPTSPKLATAKNGTKHYSSTKDQVQSLEVIVDTMSLSRSDEWKPTIPHEPKLRTLKKYGLRHYSQSPSSKESYTGWTENRDKWIADGVLRQTSPLSTRSLQLTVPAPFHLSLPSPKSRKSNAGIKEQSKHKFKARPLPFFSPSPKSTKESVPSIVPEPFKLSYEKKIETRSQSPAVDRVQAFKARPMPNFILRSVSPSPKGLESQQHQGTTPISTPRHKGKSNTPKPLGSSRRSSQARSQSATPSKRVPSPNTKSTKFRAKKMPDFSKPFVPRINSIPASPKRTKRSHPSPKPFRALPIPNSSKLYAPIKTLKLNEACSEEMKQHKEKEMRSVNINDVKTNQEKDVNDALSVLQAMQLKGFAAGQLEDTIVKLTDDCESNVLTESHAIDNKSHRTHHIEILHNITKESEKTPALVASQSIAEVKNSSNTLGMTQVYMQVKNQPNEEKIKLYASNESHSVDVTAKDNNIANECENTPLIAASQPKVEVKYSENNTSTTSGMTTSTAPPIEEQGISVRQVVDTKEKDPLELVMDRLNQSLGKLKEYEDAKMALSELTGSEMGKETKNLVAFTKASTDEEEKSIENTTARVDSLFSPLSLDSDADDESSTLSAKENNNIKEIEEQSLVSYKHYKLVDVNGDVDTRKNEINNNIMISSKERPLETTKNSSISNAVVQNQMADTVSSSSSSSSSKVDENKSSRSVGKLFDSQKFIYQLFCGSSSTRQPSPLTKRFIDNDK
jgi:hypothetical protein